MEKYIQRVAMFLVLTLTALTVSAGEKQLHVSKQVTLNASADKVWELLGDYNSLHKWHPAVASGVLKGNGQSFGDVRVLTLTDGAKIYDELTKYDSAAKTYTYRLIKSPLPIYGYLSDFTVKENGNKSTVVWSVRFYADGVYDDEAVELLSGIYDAGLNSLAAKFN